MRAIRTTEVFDAWFGKLKDNYGKAHIQMRIDRAEEGNFGDYASLGGRLFEMRIHTGPGYRIYFTQRGNELVILLVGGDKSGQPRDLRRARALEKALRDLP
ncbi:MAG: type II toxin-antitoxin system RelE/ParE family toxin [Pseudomonadota bacterium]